MLRRICNQQIQTFIDIYSDIRFPVSLEKTFWSSTLFTFLGLLLDSENQVVCIPTEKIEKAKCLVEYFTNSKNKKTLWSFKFFMQVHCSRESIPTKNLCTCFFINETASSCEYHKRDKTGYDGLGNFLNNQRVYCQPFLEFEGIRAQYINLSSDTSQCFSKGFGAICEKQWMFGVWDAKFMELAHLVSSTWNFLG